MIFKNILLNESFTVICTQHKKMYFIHILTSKTLIKYHTDAIIFIVKISFSLLNAKFND